MSITTIDTRVKRRARAVVRVLAVVAVTVLVGNGGAARAEVPKKLLEGLQATSVKVRIVAVSGVARSKDPGARALLEPMLKDEDAGVRAAVIEGLGRIGDPASLPALEAMSGDTDGTVKTVLQRVLPALRALVINIYIGEAKDLSGSTLTGLAEQLQKETRAALEKKLGPGFAYVTDPTKKGYGAAPLNIRSVSRSKDGGNSFLEIKCELTVVEMPGNILRAALSSSAAVGVAGEISKRLEPELATDAIKACAPELAGDFAGYVKERARR